MLQLGLSLTVAASVGFALISSSIVAGVVRERFDLDYAQSGIYMASIIISHCLMQLGGGWLLPRLGCRTLMLSSVGIASVAAIAVAVAPSYGWLLLARLIGGLGTAVGFVGTVRYVAMIPTRLSVAARQGLLGGFVNVGFLLAMLIVPNAVALYGWTTTFLTIAAAFLGLAILAATALQPGFTGRKGEPIPWRHLFTDRRLLSLGAAHVFAFGLFLAIVPWSIDFLRLTYGGSLAFTSLMSTLATVGAVIARTGGGPLAHHFGEQAVIRTSLLGTVMATVLLAVARNYWSSVALLLLLYLAANASFGAVFSLAARSFRGVALDGAVAVISFLSNVAALIFPVMIGMLVNATGSFSAAFWGLAGLELVGILAIWKWNPAGI